MPITIRIIRVIPARAQAFKNNRSVILNKGVVFDKIRRGLEFLCAVIYIENDNLLGFPMRLAAAYRIIILNKPKLGRYNLMSAHEIGNHVLDGAGFLGLIGGSSKLGFVYRPLRIGGINRLVGAVVGKRLGTKIFFGGLTPSCIHDRIISSMVEFRSKKR